MREFVFISHANPEDNDFARWLALQLAKEGYPVWCDLTKLLGGELFWEDIEDALRRRTAKFLYVLSSVSNSKSGPRNELALALTVKRSESIRDFVIPLKVDSLKSSDFNVEVARLNAILFQTGWAGGLLQLLKKLEEDAVPKKSSFGPAAVATWWREAMAAQGGLQRRPESLISNLYALLPTTLYFHRLGRERILGPGRISQDRALPFPAIQHNQYLVSFTPASQVLEHLEAGLTIEESVAKDVGGTNSIRQLSDILDPLEAHRALSELLRKAWERLLCERTLQTYRFANGSDGLYFLDGQVPDNRIAFLGQGGVKKRRDVIGYKTMKHPGSSSDNVRYWHFCLGAKPMVRPFLGYTMVPHVLFSDNGRDIWENKNRLHRARRSQCKNWWNDKWRDLIQAVVAWLAVGDPVITIPVDNANQIRVDATPYTIESTYSFDDQLAALPFDDDLAESEDGEDVDEGTAYEVQGSNIPDDGLENDQ